MYRPAEEGSIEIEVTGPICARRRTCGFEELGVQSVTVPLCDSVFPIMCVSLEEIQPTVLVPQLDYGIVPVLAHCPTRSQPRPMLAYSLPSADVLVRQYAGVAYANK